MTYQIAPLSVTFSDLQGHLPIASLLHCSAIFRIAVKQLTRVGEGESSPHIH